MHCIIIQTITNYNKRHNLENYEFKDLQQVSPPRSQHKTQNATFALQHYPWACLRTAALPVPASGRMFSFAVHQLWFSSFQQTYTIPNPCVYQSAFFPQYNIFCPISAHVFQQSLNGRDACEGRILIFGKINLIFCYQIWHGAALKSSLFIWGSSRSLPLWWKL